MRAALLACLFGLVLVAHAGAQGAPSAANLEAELVCPTCKTTLDQSDAPIAQEMKLYIRKRIAEGASGPEIKAELVSQFGPGVLADPPKRGFHLLAWLLPLGAALIGVAVVAWLVWAWSRTRPPDEGAEPPPDPEAERRLDAELARFER